MNEVIAALQQAEAEYQRQLAVMGERLAKSMERENALREDNEALRNQLQQAEAEVARMVEHPDVKAARLAELQQRQAELQRQIEELQT